MVNFTTISPILLGLEAMIFVISTSLQRGVLILVVSIIENALLENMATVPRKSILKFLKFIKFSMRFSFFI